RRPRLLLAGAVQDGGAAGLRGRRPRPAPPPHDVARGLRPLPEESPRGMPSPPAPGALFGLFLPPPRRPPPPRAGAPPGACARHRSSRSGRSGEGSAARGGPLGRRAERVVALALRLGAALPSFTLRAAARGGAGMKVAVVGCGRIAQAHAAAVRLLDDEASLV